MVRGVQGQVQGEMVRALIKDPIVLLADEPTGNLDHKGGDEIFALLREQLEKRGCTLVVVTHDRRFIHPDHHVVEIEDGRIIAERGFRVTVRRGPEEPAILRHQRHHRHGPL